MRFINTIENHDFNGSGGMSQGFIVDFRVIGLDLVCVKVDPSNIEVRSFPSQTSSLFGLLILQTLQPDITQFPFFSCLTK